MSLSYNFHQILAHFLLNLLIFQLIKYHLFDSMLQIGLLMYFANTTDKHTRTMINLARRTQNSPPLSAKTHHQSPTFSSAQQSHGWAESVTPAASRHSGCVNTLLSVSSFFAPGDADSQCIAEHEQSQRTNNNSK